MARDSESLYSTMAAASAAWDKHHGKGVMKLTELEPGVTEWMDIGGGHQIKFAEYGGDSHSGMRDRHLRPDNGLPCEGFITFTGSPWAQEFTKDGVCSIQTWEVQSFEPLTISPSLLCRACGDHGFIREGKWVKA